MSRRRLQELHVELGNALAAARLTVEVVARDPAAASVRARLESALRQLDRSWSAAGELLDLAGLAPRALVASDRAGCRELLALALEERGFRAVQCPSAAQAARVVDETGAPELAVVDAGLPDRGLDRLLEVLHQAGMSTKVVCFSDASSPPRGLDAVLAEPVGVDALDRVLAELGMGRRA